MLFWTLSTRYARGVHTYIEPLKKTCKITMLIIYKIVVRHIHNYVKISNLLVLSSRIQVSQIDSLISIIIYVYNGANKIDGGRV